MRLAMEPGTKSSLCWSAMRLRRVRALFIRCWKFAFISVIGVALIFDYRGLARQQRKMPARERISCLSSICLSPRVHFIIDHTGKYFNFQLNSGTGFRGCKTYESIWVHSRYCRAEGIHPGCACDGWGGRCRCIPASEGGILLKMYHLTIIN
jgi:hypothetical protein